MGFAKGMKAIEKATERKSNDFAKRVKLADGQAVEVRLINEMDDDSPHYDPARGLAGVVKQHVSPFNWLKKAECTMETEGRCWACEQAQALVGTENGKKWRWKQRFYANVLVDDKVDEPYLAYLDLATYRNNVYETIKDHFLDTGSVSNVVWKMKRSGSGQNDTTYLFQVRSIDSKPFDWPADLVPYELEQLVPTIPYDEQAAFYGVASFVEEINEETGEVSEAVKW